MSGMCVLMLIKYISHLGGVNGTQVTINLTLRAVLSCVPNILACSRDDGTDVVWCACILTMCVHVFVCLWSSCLLWILNRKIRKKKNAGKGKLTWQKNKSALHYCHMVRWPKHGGHHQGHHALYAEKTRALSHVNVLISLKLTSNGYLRFETYNIHNNSHWFIFYQSSHTGGLICAI